MRETMERGEVRARMCERGWGADASESAALRAGRASLKDVRLPLTAAPVRGTQSFVHTMHFCWTHPSLLGLEVLWRWMFGVGALFLVGTRALGIYSEATGGTNDLRRLGLDKLTITDPVGSATSLVGAAVVLLPLVWAVARWMVPLLLVVWVVVSGLGRTLVLRRVDPSLKARPVTLVMLQLVRVVALAGSVGVWFALMMWASTTAVTGPLGRGQDPELVTYFAIVIVGTIGLFTLWAVVSWVLAVAPLLAMLRGYGVLGSLRAGFRLGPLRMKLVEINLVMGIVKIALMVLALVFSACPLPFESVASQEFLTWWWLGVGVWYVLASDFFHVTRLVAYLQLWRAFEFRGDSVEGAG